MTICPVRSSWLIVNGDVLTEDGRRATGRKLGPRKKRGPEITEASRQEAKEKIERDRERRRAGVFINPRRT